ncbi:DUF1254 domain-containing protein [Nitratireductor sp. CAU 1489]|uniref:DUF1254 domain-containing protein n=1 Tax=Nitratireductor arenosus TaxID=2682096 RepID=A0A844QKR7_9HYPH|nr:DUF1254 domain-containing protein [Nitratireductor arenosus]MVA99867.1 DUF1254 domain-containing protein [Nitratireductor arenosus]
MLRLAYTILPGLVGAAIVHIAILLLLPAYAERDAWSRLEQAGAPNSFVRLPEAASATRGARAPDPFMAAGACRFDVSASGVRVQSSQKPLFWSVSVYNRWGHNIYSLNDRTASDGLLDLVVVSPDQMIDLRKELPETLAGSIIIEVEEDIGIVVVRVFRPDATFAPLVDEFFASTRCELLQDAI